ncbi:acidic endochitinase-like [Andrographis paniculata]|uniref:acidic endochitinase-like n=1 Tax=Andrographis paniculata TaxID=175694 RepID=UPI0021E799E3|nr:acidic endochitinase-like [Andrographis paniculata]
MAAVAIIYLTITAIAAAFIPPSQAAGIATYWGQNGGEGSLADACNSDNYKFINIAFLTTFGSGQSPVLNLAGHCEQTAGTCARFGDEIATCQSKGIKVLLSLGGAIGNPALASPDDARQVADYIWNNFLGGNSDSRPFGPAVLDGVDFDIESGTAQNWDVLATALSERSTAEKKVYLSAAPMCPIPDERLNGAIQTGLFDYVWVQFYNNPGCDIRAGVDALVARWNEWAALPGRELFLGLPAAEEAAPGGHIPPEVLINQVLPKIKSSEKYGGVMLWNKFYDRTYSRDILGSI